MYGSVFIIIFALLAIAITSRAGFTYYIQPLAGTGIVGSSGDDSPALSAELENPIGIWTDSAQTYMYISENGGLKVRRVELSTTIITTFAGTGISGSASSSGAATSATFQSLACVWGNSQGQIYLCDSYSSVVRVVEVATGIIAPYAGTGQAGSRGDGSAASSARLNSPQSISGDTIGNVYIADVTANSIRRVDASGIITRFAG